MSELVQTLLERPSRVLSWGAVAVVHIFAWQVLVNGLNWVNVAPLLQSVEVILVNDVAPPQLPPPSVPKVEQPISVQLFVPAPEVKVTQESAIQVAATTVPPVAIATVVSSVVPPEASSSNPVMVTESDVDYVVRPDIRFPQASKRAREHGMVLLSVIVNTRGLVEDVNVFKSSGFGRLDECARRAVRHMRVKPYLRNGVAMAIEIRIPIEFPA